MTAPRLSAPANPRHSSKSVEWASPPDVTAAARVVMGGIDLDPASSPAANRVVGARTFYTRAQDGLARVWDADRVWCNPPTPAAVWWRKLAHSWAHGFVDQAVFLGFSVEFLQTTQAARVAAAGPPLPLDFPICFPSSRLRFARIRGDRLDTRPKCPSHASCIVFLPPRAAPSRAVRTFVDVFGAFGRVTNVEGRAGRALSAIAS